MHFFKGYWKYGNTKTHNLLYISLGKISQCWEISQTSAQFRIKCSTLLIQIQFDFQILYCKFCCWNISFCSISLLRIVKSSVLTFWSDIQKLSFFNRTCLVWVLGGVLFVCFIFSFFLSVNNIYLVFWIRFRASFYDLPGIPFLKNKIYPNCLWLHIIIKYFITESAKSQILLEWHNWQIIRSKYKNAC